MKSRKRGAGKRKNKRKYLLMVLSLREEMLAWPDPVAGEPGQAVCECVGNAKFHLN